MEGNNKMSSEKPKESTSLLAAIGAIILIAGLLFTSLLANFYLNSQNPPSHVDFASALITVELQIIGLALIFAHYIRRK